MSYFNLGAYWPARELTLRQYADVTHAFLLLLQQIHPVFRDLVWVGTRPNSAIELAANLGNLDALILAHAGSARNVYSSANPDGTPSWQSTCTAGYSMVYDTGKSADGGGLSIGIRAGSYASRTPNALTISFPLENDVRFPYREFFEYAFLRNLFSQVVAFWKPETALLTSHLFSKAFVSGELPIVGWLTYLRDPRAAALRNSATLSNLNFEQMPDGGTLISLDTAIISPNNSVQVESARRLRHLLIAEKLV